MDGKIVILILIIVFSLMIASFVQAQTEEERVEIPGKFSLFWQDVRESLRIFFARDNLAKAKLALDLAEKKFEDYERYRTLQENELAGHSLKKYKKEIGIVLDVLEEETDQQQAEQIAQDVSERTMKSLAKLEESYQQAPEPLKEIISQIMADLQNCYEISQGIMTGEYRLQIQSWWGRLMNNLRKGLVKIYYKLWPSWTGKN